MRRRRRLPGEAILGTWKHRPVSEAFAKQSRHWQSQNFTVPLHYRLELPTEAETRAELAKWEQAEATARTANDLPGIRDCRAKAEQMTRQLARLAAFCGVMLDRGRPQAENGSDFRRP